MIKARPPYRFGLSRESLFAQLGLPELPQKQDVKPVKVEEPIEKPVIEEQPSPEPPAVEEPVVEEPVVEETKEEQPASTPLEALDISAKNIKLLQANNINTVEELLALEVDLEDLPKIGRAAKQAIMEGLNKWQNDQNPTTSTEEN